MSLPGSFPPSTAVIMKACIKIDLPLSRGAEQRLMLNPGERIIRA